MSAQAAGRTGQQQLLVRLARLRKRVVPSTIPVLLEEFSHVLFAENCRLVQAPNVPAVDVLEVDPRFFLIAVWNRLPHHRDIFIEWPQANDVFDLHMDVILARKYVRNPKSLPCALGAVLHQMSLVPLRRNENIPNIVCYTS